MGSSQSLPAFIFPEMSESDLKTFVSSLNSSKPNNLDLKYERTLGKGRVSWSMLVRQGSGKSSEESDNNVDNNKKSLLLMRLYAKKSGSSKAAGLNKRRSSSSLLTSMDPLSATKLSFIHELYYEKCAQLDFVLKPLLINDSDEFLVMVRPFARFNLPDRLNTESLSLQDKLWVGRQLIDNFIKLHTLRAFHGDFGSGKVFLTSQNKVIIGDFAPIKPFGLQNRSQSPLEFYQIWFDEGLDGEPGEIGRGCYLAPERLKFNSVESLEAADLFSLGCVLAELFGTRAFLQFRDVLKLSTCTDYAVYDSLIVNYISKCGIVVDEMVPLIKRLCSKDPEDRKLSTADLMSIESLIDPEISKWRTALNNYRTARTFEEKRAKILEFPEKISDFEGLLLLTLKEKNPILAAHLVNYLLNGHKNVTADVVSVLMQEFENEDLVRNVIYGNLMRNQELQAPKTTLPLIAALNEGNRESILQQISKEDDLKGILSVLEHRNLEKDKLMSIYNKILQLYRARDAHDADFESQLAFEYLKMPAGQEDLNALFNTFKLSGCFLNEEAKEPASLMRIAFQLDLEKNNVPIEKESDFTIPISKQQHMNNIISYPRMKQRLMVGPIPLSFDEDILGIVQSPDKKLVVFYSASSFEFWDLKSLIKGSEQNINLARVNPRANAICTSVIFGNDSESIFVAFKDGIIGRYQVTMNTSSGIEFQIKESFGPFESDNLKLLLTATQSGLVLLAVGQNRIYGIALDGGEVLFEMKFKEFIIKQVIDCIEGCLLCLDDEGRFRLIEIFYETGQVLASWQLKESGENAFEMESASIKPNESGSKFNLSVKLGSKIAGKVVLVFVIDPASEVVACSFRHWILTNQDEKTLPSINLIRLTPSTNKSMSIRNLSIFNKSLCCLDEEFVEVSDGIVRLIDFSNLSSLNTSSMIYPLTYKPAMKLRNKRASVPEIIERSEKITEQNICGIMDKLQAGSDNILIAAIIKGELLLFC